MYVSCLREKIWLTFHAPVSKLHKQTWYTMVSFKLTLVLKRSPESARLMRRHTITFWEKKRIVSNNSQTLKKSRTKSPYRRLAAGTHQPQHHINQNTRTPEHHQRLNSGFDADHRNVKHAEGQHQDHCSTTMSANSYIQKGIKPHIQSAPNELHQSPCIIDISI